MYIAFECDLFHTIGELFYTDGHKSDDILQSLSIYLSKITNIFIYYAYNAALDPWQLMILTNHVKKCR
jgi:hypothetical protein